MSVSSTELCSLVANVDLSPSVTVPPSLHQAVDRAGRQLLLPDAHVHSAESDRVGVPESGCDGTADTRGEAGAVDVPHARGAGRHLCGLALPGRALDGRWVMVASSVPGVGSEVGDDWGADMLVSAY